jgi:hypothetical protein
VSPIACLNRTYCPPGSVEPRICQPGFYCPRSMYELPCPAGFYCPLGSSYPLKCPLGYYCDPSLLNNRTGGVIKPTLCPKGNVTLKWRSPFKQSRCEVIFDDREKNPNKIS